MLPWITSRLTARARARTHADTDVCAAVLMVDITAIQAAPAPTSTAPATTASRTIASVALARANSMVASIMRRSVGIWRRSAGSTVAAATAPRPRQPTSTPYPRACRPSSWRETSGSRDQTALANRTKDALRAKTVRSGREWRT
jgi:hypothetical protein